MKVLSLFSGVGGFDLGLENAGMKTVFQCEWDEYATKILERHWPNVPRWGDISTLTGEHVLSHAPEIDVVAWGSPCQDLSIAGNRVGLKGEKSSLFHEGIRIIKEIRELTNGRYPRISIWENVPGALNSNKGEDFKVILNEMAEAGALVQEWRVLDAQYFGVPQRRRRVFLVSIFDPATSERCPDPLFPIPESLCRDHKESPEKREKTTGGTLKITTKSNKPRNVIGFSHNQGFSPQASKIKWPTLRFGGRGHGVSYEFPVVAPTLTASNDPSRSPQSSEITQQVTAVHEATMVVRRLTPLECERLMGWPDNWTEGQSDTRRYKQCGNGVASPVAEWIGEIIIKHLA